MIWGLSDIALAKLIESVENEAAVKINSFTNGISGIIWIIRINRFILTHLLQ